MPTNPQFDTDKHQAQREKAREYRATNKDKRKKWNRDWIAKNRERYNASKLIYRDRLKVETFKAYGGCSCIRCGISDLDVLCLDHINDDGASHRKELNISSRGNAAGVTTYAALKKLGFPKGRFQVLCANCNLKKEISRKMNERMKNEHYKHYIETGEMPTVKNFKGGSR